MVVGNGPPEDIPDFADHTGYREHIVTDPSLSSFVALGFTRKLSGILSVNALMGGLKALGKGHRQKGIKGDAIQLGGVAVVASGPVLYYYYRSTQAADHPPIEKLLAACATEKPLWTGS